MVTLRTRPVLVTLILTLSLLPMACGWFGGNAPTSTTEHKRNPSTTTTTATGSGGPTEAQRYRLDMNKWAGTYWADADVEALAFKKPVAPTTKETRRAKAFASAMHASFDVLGTVRPPAEAAEAHAQFCAAFSTELRAVDRFIRGIETKNKRDIELAGRDAAIARAAELQAREALSPYLGATGTSTSTTGAVPSTAAAAPSTTSSPTG